jgi:hypothetical protein
MSSPSIVRNYPNSTKVMRRDGNIFVKVGGEWKAEHRLIAEFKLLNRELLPGEKVCHRDNTTIGEEGYNEDANLVVIRCRTKKWTKLKKSKVIFLPKEAKTKDLVLR